MLNWPCIIKHSDDPELVYVRSQSDWDGDADLHAFEYADSDFLVDSSGNVYTLTLRRDGHARPEPTGRAMRLAEILGLVKAHAAHKGSCCVAKLYAPTITAAFGIVESMEDS